MFAFVHSLLVKEEVYIFWLVQESILICLITTCNSFFAVRPRVHILVCYLLLIVNIVWLCVISFGIDSSLFIQFLKFMLFSNVATESVTFGPGEIGQLLQSVLGIKLNRISFLFDQPSTYFSLITLCAITLALEQRLKFSLLFLITGFLACPAKISVILIPLYLVVFMSSKHQQQFKVLSNYLAFITVLILVFSPILISVLVKIYYQGDLTLDYADSAASRVYFTWLVGTGVMPWEISWNTPRFVYAEYDGIAASFPFFLSGLVTALLFHKARPEGISLIMVLLLTLQYGSSLTMAFFYFVVLSHIKTLIALNYEKELQKCNLK